MQLLSSYKMTKIWTRTPSLLVRTCSMSITPLPCTNVQTLHQPFPQPPLPLPPLPTRYQTIAESCYSID